MHICTGLINFQYLKQFIDAGADEFYCGVIDEKWLSKYNYVVPLNRRPWPEANMADFKELREVVNLAHLYKCKIFFTLNEHCYNNNQLSILDYYIEQAIDSGVDAIIFSEPGLVKYFGTKCKDVEVHISTGGAVLNSYTAKFYIEELNADRIILPRVISINETERIINHNPSIDYEVFIKNEGCTYIDSFCNFIHGVRYIANEKNQIFNPPCELRYKVIEVESETKSSYLLPQIEEKLNKIFDNKADCGICSLYYLNQLQIKSLKLVGRATDPQSILEDIKLIRYAIDLCGEVDCFDDYYEKITRITCKNNINKDKSIIYCYYPEILEKLKKGLVGKKDGTCNNY